MDMTTDELIDLIREILAVCVWHYDCDPDCPRMKECDEKDILIYDCPRVEDVAKRLAKLGIHVLY